jgi:hypothetical protein
MGRLLRSETQSTACPEIAHCDSICGLHNSNQIFQNVIATLNLWWKHLYPSSPNLSLNDFEAVIAQVTGKKKNTYYQNKTKQNKKT